MAKKTHETTTTETPAPSTSSAWHERVLEYDDGAPNTFSVTLGQLSEETIFTLLERGVSHVLGQEVTSRDNSMIRAAIKAARAADDKSVVTTAEVKAYRNANADEVNSWHTENFSEKARDILNGSLGTSRRGPKARYDAIDKIALSLLFAHFKTLADLRGYVGITKAQLEECSRGEYEKNREVWRARAEVVASQESDNTSADEALAALRAAA